jgi:DNA sulfur modification protein DndE
MKLTKVRLSKDASNRLRFVAGKTGLTPNLLCRLGLTLSLMESRVPDPEAFPEEDREFNRYTLLGEFDPLFIALVRQRCEKDGIHDAELLPAYFRAHLNRGIGLLQHRVRHVSDLAAIAGS